MDKKNRCNNMITLVPKLQLGNSALEALASIHTKLELRHSGSQAGAWELVEWVKGKI